MFNFNKWLLSAIRNWPTGIHRAVLVTLAGLLAVGTLTIFPAQAHAAVPEVRTALPAGYATPDSFFASGSTFVAGWYDQNAWMGWYRSTDSGAHWSSDAALDQNLVQPRASGWSASYNGNLFGYVQDANGTSLVSYSIASDTTVSYPLPSSPSSVGGDWAVVGSPTLGSATIFDFVAQTSVTAVAPADPMMSSANPYLSPDGKLIWVERTNDMHTKFAVAAAPDAAPGPWVTIDDVFGYYWSNTYVFTDSEMRYLSSDSTGVNFCTRQLADLASAPVCVPVWAGQDGGNYYSLYNFGSSLLMSIHRSPVGGGAMEERDYWWNGTSVTRLAVDSLSMPAGAGREYGAPAHLWSTTAADGFTGRPIATDGSLGAPISRPASLTYPLLSLAPDRMVGADDRNGTLGSDTLVGWTRSVSSSGFGTESVLPDRASMVATSAGRTLVSGTGGLIVYDRGQVSHTFDSAALAEVSGPYVAPRSGEASIVTVDGASVGTFTGWGKLFGSRYATFDTTDFTNGELTMVVHDLTGATAPHTVTLSMGITNGSCYQYSAWNDLIGLTCYDNTNGSPSGRIFNLSTGAMVTTIADKWLEALGDGYAVVSSSNGNGGILYEVVDLATSATTPLTDCIGSVVTDGVGHVACESATELIWRDFSSLSLSAPRLLGVLAPASVGFAAAGTTWKPEFDATKPLAAGSVVIKNSSGTVVRSLPTVASADGSVRGVSWDGLDGAGTAVPVGTYSFTLVAAAADGSGTVVSVDGSGPASGSVTVASSAASASVEPGGVVAVSPSRVADTRLSGGALGAGATRSVQVTGVGGVPASGVSAVVLNVTVTETTSGGYLTVFPTGAARPTASNLNWSSGGTTVPNAVTVKVGAGGKVDLFQSGPGSAQVIVDVASYFLDGSVTEPGAFTPVSPARALDTRSSGGAILAGQSRTLVVAGSSGVPASGVSAVVLNVTVTETTSGGYLTAFPTGTSRPNASNLNWSSAGVTIPNLVIVKLGDAGSVDLYQSGPGSAQVIADVAGYYLDGTVTKPGMFVALAPSRLLDTRSTGAVAAGGDVSLSLAGKGGLPVSGIAAVVINTTVTETRAGGYLTVYPGGTSLPTASNLNWSSAGVTIPNLVTVQNGTGDVIKFHNGSPGTTQVIADTAGYYLA